VSEPAEAEIVESWLAQGTPFRAVGVTSRVWSYGEGPVAVCIHGVPSSSYLFRKVLPELAARGMRGVALDLPGLGGAERPRDFDYRWSSLAKWLNAALGEIGIDDAHFVVHDIGGPITFEALRLQPEQASSITALDTIARPARFQRPPSARAFARPLLGRLALKATSARQLEKALRKDCIAGPISSEEVRAYHRLLKRDDGGHAFLRVIRGFELTQEFEDRIAAHLHGHPYPAQVLWGDRDPWMPAEDQGEWARELLGAPEVQRLPGLHFIQESAAAEIAERVASLAQSIEASATKSSRPRRSPGHSA